MSLATWHFHIEISSKCTLRCPRCARAEVPESLINTELDLDFFHKNFTPDFINKNVEKLTFCGDDGDPIYAHDLIEVIRYVKSVKPVEIVIVTNGSHKKSEWWRELGSVLTDKDTVHFSIDGWDNESNNVYRVNSDFESITAGFVNLHATSQCRIIWDAIAFKFNEHNINYMISMAQKWGFDAFQLTRSTKFGKIYPTYKEGESDPLQPSDMFVSNTHRFQRDVFKLSDRELNDRLHPMNIVNYNKVKEQNGVRPLCEIGNKGLYINARGELYPCCWVANRYSHNQEWLDRAKDFNLNNRTLTDVLADDFWNNEFKKFDSLECKTKCKSILVDEKYGTEW